MKLDGCYSLPGDMDIGELDNLNSYLQNLIVLCD